MKLKLHSKCCLFCCWCRQRHSFICTSSGRIRIGVVVACRNRTQTFLSAILDRRWCSKIIWWIWSTNGTSECTTPINRIIVWHAWNKNKFLFLSIVQWLQRCAICWLLQITSTSRANTRSRIGERCAHQRFGQLSSQWIGRDIRCTARSTAGL